MKLSPAIPAPNEAENIGALLERLSCAPGVSRAVSHGGLTDVKQILERPELVPRTAGVLAEL